MVSASGVREVNNEIIFEDLCVALEEFGEEYHAEKESDGDDWEEECRESVEAFALDIMRYFEEAYSNETEEEEWEN